MLLLPEDREATVASAVHANRAMSARAVDTVSANSRLVSLNRLSVGMPVPSLFLNSEFGELWMRFVGCHVLGVRPWRR